MIMALMPALVSHRIVSISSLEPPFHTTGSLSSSQGLNNKPLSSSQDRLSETGKPITSLTAIMACWLGPGALGGFIDLFRLIGSCPCFKTRTGEQAERRERMRKGRKKREARRNGCCFELSVEYNPDRANALDLLSSAAALPANRVSRSNWLEAVLVSNCSLLEQFMRSLSGQEVPPSCSNP